MSTHSVEKLLLENGREWGLMTPSPTIAAESIDATSWAG